MTRKKKRIDQPSETTASHHRNFTMMSTSETPQINTNTPRPGMAADDYYASPGGQATNGTYPSGGNVYSNTTTYQREAVVVDQVPPDSSSVSSSDVDLEKGKDGKDRKPGFCASLTRILFILLLIILLVVGLFCLCMGVAIEVSPDLANNDSISFLGLAAIIHGTLSLILFIFGIASCHSRRKAPYIIFVILLLASAAVQIYGTLKASENIQAIQGSTTDTWEGLSDPHRLWLQATLNCCGFEDDQDRPGSVCPSSFDGGCKAHLDDLGVKAHDGIFDAMYASVGLDVLLMILAIILLFTSTRKKKYYNLDNPIHGAAELDGPSLSALPPHSIGSEPELVAASALELLDHHSRMVGESPKIATPGAEMLAETSDHIASDQGYHGDSTITSPPDHLESPIVPPPASSNGRPKNDPISPSLPDSTTPVLASPLDGAGGMKEDGHRTFCYNMLVCCFNCLTTLLIIICCLLIFFGSRLIELADPLGIDDQFRILPSVIIQGAVVLLVVLVWGVVAYLIDSPVMGGVYIFGLTLLYATQIFHTWELNSHLQSRVLSLTQHWDDLTPSAKNAIQAIGNCCGYLNLDDRPGNFCPSLAQYGCKQQLYDIVLGIRRAMSDALILSFLAFVALSVLIYFITDHRASPSPSCPEDIKN